MPVLIHPECTVNSCPGLLEAGGDPLGTHLSPFHLSSSLGTGADHPPDLPAGLPGPGLTKGEAG